MTLYDVKYDVVDASKQRHDFGPLKVIIYFHPFNIGRSFLRYKLLSSV